MNTYRSGTDIQPSRPDGLSALNGYDLQDTAGNGLDFYNPTLPAYFQWETLEPVDWSTFTGLLQHQDNLADSLGQHISQSNEIQASPDWEAKGHLDAHISIAGAHTSSQDIDQAAFNWPSPSPSHTLTRPQPPAKKAVRKRKTSSSEPLAPKWLQINLKPALDTEVDTQGEAGYADRGDVRGHRKKNRAHKRAQERNRIAASKFRHRRREEMEKVYSKEQDLEKINFNLTGCLKDLVAEAHQLKMNLLQHTTCECTLIHKYIQNEAQRYIERRKKNSSLSDAELAPNHETSLTPNLALSF
ncbi:hypothetical protein BKA59DRAFT_409282 [Fusarium tricinctum]|uniref:BZIP domain-containing protein n=1 Tax=Fusarium tricinctum TaxID=61284 RepID=A0A8K0RNB5_9HYPO|nr:hypothetical protein BKA59DRAFT_409282 [Fusarium tricinctum]